MTITCIPKFIAQEEGIARFYLATETRTGYHAHGATHFQAISNLLGLLFINNVTVHHPKEN